MNVKETDFPERFRPLVRRLYSKASGLRKRARRYFVPNQGEKHRRCLRIGEHFQRRVGAKDQVDFRKSLAFEYNSTRIYIHIPGFFAR